MIRPVFARVLCAGRTCLQSNQRLLQYQYQPCSFQYFHYRPSRNIITVTRLLISRASDSVRSSNNYGLVRQVLRRRCSSKAKNSTNTTSTSATSSTAASTEAPQKLSLFARFKQMYKDYW